MQHGLNINSDTKVGCMCFQVVELIFKVTWIVPDFSLAGESLTSSVGHYELNRTIGKCGSLHFWDKQFFYRKDNYLYIIFKSKMYESNP